MSKTLAIMLAAAFAVAALTTTTTMQIQPAYSQATHCNPGVGTCITPGQTPRQTTNGLTSFPSHQEAGQGIGEIHQGCEGGPPGSYLGCTVTVGKPVQLP
jgi:hypothetical protein